MYPASYWKKSINQCFGSKYLLRKFLGFGAYGAVFRADEMLADRLIQSVAIKLVIVDLEHLDRQIEELQLAVRLRHPHLINGFTCEQGGVNGDLCLGLVMELADDSLESYLTVNKPPLTIELVSNLVQHLAEGLAYIHSQGIIHRDLKPANILRVGESWKLADFGIARSLQDGTSTYTNASQQIGTASYMPPESYEGKISPAWDTWSLGIMTAQLLTGNHPFPAQTVLELMKVVLTDPPILSKDLGSPFREIVAGCLLKEPKDRWTAQQVLTALQTPVIQFATPRIPLFPSSKILTLNLPNNIKLEMIKIPSGSFLMGSADNDPNAYYNEKPQHRVTLQEYYLGKYPVTQEQYQAVIGKNPSKFKDNSKNPVEHLSWNDAKVFCQKIYETTRQKVRLPTEAEWEYGCRAGTTTPFYFGETISTEQANHNGNHTFGQGKKGSYQKKTTPVESFSANKFGLYDMHGNVWEWCEDSWHDSYDEKSDNLKSNGNTTWLSSNESRHILRGGSWFYHSGYCRSAVRHWGNADNWRGDSSFRLALSIF